MYQSRIRQSKKRNDKVRVFVEPERGQCYGLVQELCGNGRTRCLCADGKVRSGRIRGSMRKYRHKVIIERGDLVLVCTREFEDDHVDIVHKYRHDEMARLLRDRELPDAIFKAITQADTATGTRPGDEYVEFAETAETVEARPSAAGDAGDAEEDISEEYDTDSDLDVDAI